MDYTVCVDTTGQAAQALMGAAGVSGIPHAFIVDAGGTVRHHGHPMEPQWAQALERVCSAAAAGGQAPQQQQQQQQAAAAAQRELPRVTASREELMAMPVSVCAARCD